MRRLARRHVLQPAASQPQSPITVSPSPTSQPAPTLTSPAEPSSPQVGRRCLAQPQFATERSTLCSVPVCNNAHGAC